MRVLRKISTCDAFGTSFSSHSKSGRRPDQLYLPHLFFVPLLGRETIPEVKERRPQDGRCESPTAEECAPMCGWEIWLGVHRREGGAGAPLSFCPSGPALFGRAICWSRPKVSTVVLVVFLRWRKCFGGPIMSKWKLANGKKSNGLVYLDTREHEIRSFRSTVTHGVWRRNI